MSEQPQAYSAPQPGYPPSIQQPVGDQPSHTMPSPPPQSYATPDPSLASQPNPGYAPSSMHTSSQYGAPAGAAYAVPPSAYSTPPQNYGVPAPAPGPVYGAAPGQTQSVYGAPQPWGYGQQPPPVEPNGQMPMYGAAPQAMGPPAPAPAPAAGAAAGTAATGPKICGVPRVIFWIVLIAAILLILGGLGAGLGVGLSNRNNNASASSSDDISPVPTLTLDPNDPSDPTTTPTTTRTRTSGSTTTANTRTATRTTATGSIPTPTQTITNADVSCPANHNTYYTVSSVTQFRVLCSTVITGTYLHSNHTTNMGTCMRACANDSSCTGVLWWFSDTITDNCDMYVGLDEDNPTTTTTDVAFGAYDWIWDLRRKRTVKRDGVVFEDDEE